MRVVTAAHRSRRFALRPATAADTRASRIERLGLTAVTLVIALGAWLVYGEQIRTVDACRSAAPAATGETACVNLSTVRSASDLLPALHIFDDSAERMAIASAIASHLNARHAAIDHVGSLAAITMPAARVRAQPGLVHLNERLQSRSTLTDVPVVNSSELAAIKASVIVRTPADYRRQMLATALLFLLSFWLAHAIRSWGGTTGDPILLPSVALVCGLGLMTMIALRDPLRDTVIARGFADGVAAGCVIWIALSFVDFEQPLLRRAVLAPLGIAVAMATALLAFGSGPAGSGAKVNLLGIQPVEAIRLLVVFALAAYFSRRWPFLREFSESVGPSAQVRRLIRLPRWKDVRPLLITIATLLAFFFLQKDLGPALVISCVFLGLYGMARGRVALVLCGCAVLVAGFLVGYTLGVPATVAQRVAMWLNPWDNALPGGDQISQALWALATGGFSGLGPGVGDPQLIPAGHTDLVLAALGEDLGYVGVASALITLALIVWRMLGIGLRAPGDYTAFLAIGLTLALAAQTIVIVGGMLGLLPLAGVVTPFMSFGRSSMLSNFAAVAICAVIARRRAGERIAFTVPIRTLQWTLAGAAAIILVRVGFVQVAYADGIAGQANLTRQADGGYRYQYNPRLVAAAHEIRRGTIFDRNGLPLATSDRGLLATFAERYQQMGVTVDCPERETRCYPLGGMAFHLIGDAEHEVNWAARNTSFAEQEFDARLSGFDDHAQTVPLRHPQTGATIYAVRRDYRALLPLVRHKENRTHPDVQRLLGSTRDISLTVDAGLQVRTARALRTRVMTAGSGRGAAVVLDPTTGELLASVSYPWPDARELRGDVTPDPVHLLDRARYGLYPPGSTFKLITAVAALRSDPAAQRSTFDCVKLPDGRVGGHVPGVARAIRDDAKDTVPHGKLDMHKALVVSCNAYFANLAHKLGSKALAEAAAAAQISVAPAPAESNLARSLPFAGYGQGGVVATPLRMARATAALASDGILRDVVVAKASASPPRDSTSASTVAGILRVSTQKPSPAPQSTSGVRWVDARGAALLRRDMREVVTSGTGRILASHPGEIGGKTGTAELDGQPSHGWFVGFAPYASPRIAFAVIIEHGGYGGRVAAPLAGEIVSAAESRGLLAPREAGTVKDTRK
jgi:cell division protein FtsW (lipid II flippase)/cell division protein FtsI/penicillin-binding protein 2